MLVKVENFGIESQSKKRFHDKGDMHVVITIKANDHCVINHWV
jgi:hypothetical protein